MKQAFPLIQIIFSTLLSIAILLQGRGAGLGASFGGGGEFYRSKRGVEQILFKATIILIGLFLLSSLGSIIFS